MAISEVKNEHLFHCRSPKSVCCTHSRRRGKQPTGSGDPSGSACCRYPFCGRIRPVAGQSTRAEFLGCLPGMAAALECLTMATRARNTYSSTATTVTGAPRCARLIMTATACARLMKHLACCGRLAPALNCICVLRSPANRGAAILAIGTGSSRRKCTMIYPAQSQSI